MPRAGSARTALVRKSDKTPIHRSLLKSSQAVPIIIAVAIVLAVVIALTVGGSKPKAPTLSKNIVNTACGPYRKDGNVVIDGQKIIVEIAKNSEEFDKGLAGRPCITADQGMFFAFNRAGHYPFWMKGMKFPIDIIWITSAHRVAAIEVNESPNTYPDKFVNKTPAQYVLELRANRSTELHMSIGTSVTF